MFRAFDLSAMEDVVNELLNSPYLRLQSMKISCSAETAYTVASLRLIPCEKQERKFIRKVERFPLVAGAHPLLDERLSNKDIQLIHQYVFPTSEGTIVVLDYQIRKERQSDF